MNAKMPLTGSVLVAFAGGHGYSMLKLIINGIEAFGSGFEAARQVDYEGGASLHADSAREHGSAGFFHAGCSHGLDDAGYVTLAYVGGGFGGDVFERKAAATAGQHDITFE